MDAKAYNMLLQINGNLLRLIRLMEDMKNEGIKVRTQESHV